MPAPSTSNARSLALGAAFFTFLAIVATAAIIGAIFFGLAEKLKVPDPRQAQITAWYVAIASAVLADILTLLFVGQIGWPLRRPACQKSVAGFFVYVLMIPAAMLIGEQCYPVIEPARESMRIFNTPFGSDDVTRRVLIWGVVTLTAAVMLVLRYAGVVGRGRRAIRKLLAGES